MTPRTRRLVAASLQVLAVLCMVTVSVFAWAALALHPVFWVPATSLAALGLGLFNSAAITRNRR